MKPAPRSSRWRIPRTDTAGQEGGGEQEQISGRRLGLEYAAWTAQSLRKPALRAFRITRKEETSMKHLTLALLLLFLPLGAMASASEQGTEAPDGATSAVSLPETPDTAALCTAPQETFAASTAVGFLIRPSYVCECEVDSDCAWKTCSADYHPVCGSPQTCGRCICNHN
jgi:hypothetical protein